jgi:hypothetical protein
MKITGGCHCGAIAFEGLVDPEQVTICHCTDCQSLTGTAYRVSVPCLKEHFRLTKGAPSIYVKTGESGAKRAQAFCSNCGSPIYTHAIDNPVNYGLRVGCIDQRRALAPRKQKWCRSALGWAMDISGLPGQRKE